MTLTALGQAPLLGNRYRLGGRIAQGGAAEIYEATDVHLGQDVAVKILKADDGGPELAKRFAEEARLLAAVGHPNLVPLLDAGRQGACRYLVMPLIRGEDLARIIWRGPLPPTEAARVGAALADALDHIHARGIVHRDLKPANVLVAPDGGVFLADFGIAHAWDGPVHTAVGCVVGTAGYMAPEQARGYGAGPASDLFSLGLILLEALTGRPEYTGPAMERIAGVVNRQPRIPAGLTPQWRSVLAAMLRREPARRPTAGQLRDLIYLTCEPALPSAHPAPRHGRPATEPGTPSASSPIAATPGFAAGPAGRSAGFAGSPWPRDAQRGAVQRTGQAWEQRRPEAA